MKTNIQSPTFRRLFLTIIFILVAPLSLRAVIPNGQSPIYNCSALLAELGLPSTEILDPETAKTEQWIKEESYVQLYDAANAKLPKDVHLIPLEVLIGSVREDSDLSDLIGEAVVGSLNYPNIVHPFIDGKFVTRNHDLLVNGVVTAVRTIPNESAQSHKVKVWPHDMPDVELTLQSKGNSRKVRFVSRWNYRRDYSSNLNVLQKKNNSKELLKLQFQSRLLTQGFQWFFNGPAEIRDFDIAYAIAYTYLTLPGNYGVTGTVATLRGQSAKTKNHKYYGLLANSKRYSKVGLENFVRELELWMTWHQVISLTRPSEDQYWLLHRQTGKNAQSFLETLDQLREQPGSPLDVPNHVLFDKTAYKRAAITHVDFDQVAKFAETLQAEVEKSFGPNYHIKFVLNAGKNDLAVVKKSRTGASYNILYQIKNVTIIGIHEARGIRWAELHPFINVTFGSSHEQIINSEFFWAQTYPPLSADLVAAPELERGSTLKTIFGLDQILKQIAVAVEE